MKKVAVSLLIPTMNRPDALERTLESYFSAAFYPSQLIVVDQSDEVDVARLVETIVNKYSDITETLYVYQKTPSLTAARNRAMLYADNDVIVCSDDDIDVYNDTLKNVFSVMQDDSIAMIAGIDDNSNVASGKIGYLVGTKSYKYRNQGHVTQSMLGRFPSMGINQVTTTMWAMGFFFVIRKSIVTKYRLKWDEKLPSYAYAEDLDFSFMYYKCSLNEKKKCILNPDVHVKHRVSQEYRIPSTKATYMYVLNRWYLSYKHNMRIISRIAMLWCDSWKYIGRIIKKEKPQDLLNAICYAVNNRRALQRGILKYPF